MSKLSEALHSGKFVITSEIGPPKGINIEKYLQEAETYFRERITAVNVTDLQSAVMRLGSLAVCHLLKERGLEPVLQIVCRDRNRLALQSDLLSGAVLGIENVLCLTGDHTTLGDHPDAKPVFDLDSVQLLMAAKKLQEGFDLAGKPLDGVPKFFLGAVVTPGADPLEPQIMKMEKKVKVGAQFFQTQAVFEVDKFINFIEKVKHIKVPVLAGIVVLKSVGMARYMNNNVSGVYIPDEIIEKLKVNPEKTKSGEVGVEIAANLIRQLKPYCQGIHLMPLGWDDKVPAILDAAGL